MNLKNFNSLDSDDILTPSNPTQEWAWNYFSAVNILWFFIYEAQIQTRKHKIISQDQISRLTGVGVGWNKGMKQRMTIYVI